MDEIHTSQSDSESVETRERKDGLLGIQIGNYRISRMLGEGGMGAVYEAAHIRTSHRIAVKFLRQSALGDSEPEAVRLKRFLDEARALGAGTHPNLVEFIDSGELPSGELYIMMELVPGTTLRDFVVSQEGKLSAPLALELTRQTAAALAFIHGLGIAHRDLNPRNLMVLQDSTARNGWRIKLLDFGIAKFTDRREYRTRTQSQLGTIRYMSPEQCEAAKSVDESTDIYSLGLMLFELLTGESPYLMADGQETKWIDAHVNRAPRSLRTLWPEAPAPLTKLVAEMLDKHPDYRPRAKEIAAHLDSGERIPERRGPISANLSLGFLLSTALIPGVGSVSLGLLSPPKSPAAAEALTSPELAYVSQHAPVGTVLVDPVQLFMGSTPEEIAGALAECRQRNGEAACSPETFQREGPVQLVSVSAFYLDETEMTNAHVVKVIHRFHEEFDLNAVKGKPPRLIFLRESTGKRTLFFDLWNSGVRGSGLQIEQGQLVVRSGMENFPAVQLTHEAARRICQKRGGDLPSEAQWEAAARGNERRRFPWGNLRPTCDGVIVDRVDGGLCKGFPINQPDRVGTASLDITPRGVRDLGGNVLEWVLDPFVSPYPRCGTCKDPVARVAAETMSETTAYSVRGGSYFLSQEVARASSRSMAVAQAMTPNLGFRCAIPVTSK